MASITARIARPVLSKQRVAVGLWLIELGARVAGTALRTTVTVDGRRHVYDPKFSLDVSAHDD